MATTSIKAGPFAERNQPPKTVNNVLAVLNTLLKKAVEWGDLDRLPCTIKLLSNPKKTMGFHDFEECERLLTVAQKRTPQAYLMVLLGGMRDFGLGKSWRSNGATLICTRVGSPSSGPTGAVTSRCRKAGGVVAFL